MRKHTIEVTERELRAILAAFDVARDETVNHRWAWWVRTQYAERLYHRLREHGLERVTI